MSDSRSKCALASASIYAMTEAYRTSIRASIRSAVSVKRAMTVTWFGPTLIPMAAAFITALSLAFICLAVSGIGTAGIIRALQLTARFSFIPFWFAYAGSSLATLFGPRFRPIARHGRGFGLSFASAHLVHVLLVIWLYQISPKPPVTVQTAILFGIGVFWTYFLALLSIERLAVILASKVRRTLYLIGMEYIMFAFQWDFVLNAFNVNVIHLLAYLPFAGVGLAGTAFRVLRYIKTGDKINSTRTLR